MKNAQQWFEIPVRSLDVATPFYEAVIGAAMHREIFGGLPYAVFPFDAPGTGGALVADPRRTPGPQGVTLYLTTHLPLEAALAAAVAKGGEVMLPVTPIGKDGAIAIFRDLDGNAVGLNVPA